MIDNYSSQNSANELEKTANFKKPTLLQVGILYSLCVILLIFIGSRVQHAEFYSGILITEFGLVLVPTLLLLFIFRYDVKNVLRLNRINIVNIALIIGIMICALPLVGILNGINLILIKSIFGKIIINQPPTAETGIGLLINILVIGGSAGICEELLFRGTIQRGFERFGTVKAILFTSILFGMMHVDFQKLLGTFLLGALIGFIVYRTNSIFGGMIAHFTNNSIAVILAYAATKLSKVMNSSGAGTAISGNIDMSLFNSLPKDQQMVVIVVWAFMALSILAVFGGLFTLLIFIFIKRTSNRVNVEKTEESAPGWQFIGLLPGIAMIALIYFIQGLKLKGIPSPLIDNILGILGLK